MFRIQTCCNYILSAAEGFRGQEATCADPGIFCQSYLVLILFYGLKRGSNGFIAEKTILILYQGSRGGPLLSRGWGVKFFQVGGGGGQMLISLDIPCTYLLFSGGGGGCPYPLSPSGSAHGQCHHNGAIFITVPLLTNIVRH